MKNKKRGKKKEIFNKGTYVFLIGLILLVLTFVSKLIFDLIEIIFYLEIFDFLLIYFGLVMHFIFAGDKPFSKSWDFLRESKKFFYFTILLFFIFVLIGYFVPAPMEVQDAIKEYIKQLLLETQGLSTFGLIKFIFLNNLQVSFFGVVLGALFGIFPLIYTIGNGYILGFVSKLAVSQGGLQVLLQLVPHGIFELPAVFISLSLGFKLASFILQKDKGEAFRKYLLNSLRVFVFIVIPLLIIAAVIEGSLI